MVEADFISAVLDANVLFSGVLCDLFIRTALAQLYRAYWTEEILDEAGRNLIRQNRATAAGEQRRRTNMQRALPDATVTGYESLIPQMTNDPKDRHVLAAAVHVGAGIIVTQNLRHFPTASLAPYGVIAVSADTFLRGLLERAPDVMVRIIAEQAADLRRPPQSVRQVLDNLATEAPTFVRAIAPLFEETNEGEYIMLHTRVCDLLGIEHPVINAPMAGTATATLAAAVSAAGGFGLIGGSGGDADWLRAQIRAVRERTARPFGVGFISHYPGLDALVRVALEERVAAVTHSFADPSPYVAAAHDAGVKILAQVQTVERAVAAAYAGVDAIAAQGTEAGGHTGTQSATLPLVPAVVDAVGEIPVIAAGGIADGRGLAAALMLGADGVWMGTRFMATPEWGGKPWVRDRLLTAGADDTVLTRAYDLALARPFGPQYPARAIRNAFTDAWHARDNAVAEQQAELHAQIKRAEGAGDANVAEVLGGNAVGLVHTVEPAGDIVRRIVAEAEAILRTRPAHLLR